MDNCVPSVVGVIDLLDGVAVRAIGGRRARYRPWHSPLADSSDPLAIARAFRAHYNITEIYIADLNALRGEPTTHEAARRIIKDGFRVTLDAGPRHADEIATALEVGVESAVIPLETLRHRSELPAWSREFDPRRLAFGLDLANGVPLADSRVWNMADWRADAPQRIAEDVLAMGISKLVLLDLRAVGRQTGPTITRLCQQLRQCAPTATIWTGGGVRNAHDIAHLRAAGADRILLATALHERPPAKNPHAASADSS